MSVPQAGRVALVSGGEEGVGFQLVRSLSAMGLRVVLGCRSVERGRRAIDGLGELADRVGVRRLDVTDADSVERLAAWVAARLGRCDVLVCNLTLVHLTYLDAADDELTRKLYGIRHLARSVAPMMRASGYGRVVTVCSGHRMTHCAVDAFTRALSDEIGGDGILANSYCAGLTEIGGTVPAAAAETPVWLATLPDDGPTGEVYGYRA